jgi:hypothetical protein
MPDLRRFARATGLTLAALTLIDAVVKTPAACVPPELIGRLIALGLIAAAAGRALSAAAARLPRPRPAPEACRAR